MAFSFKFWNRKARPNDTRQARRGWFTRGKTVINEDSAMQVSAFNRGVIYISSQVAKLPWVVKDAQNKEVVGQVGNLLDLAPNTEMNAFSFRLLMIQQAIIHGNAYAEIERNTVGAPVALWPLKSQDVELIRAPDRSLVYRIRSSEGGSAEVYLPTRDMFHIKNFHTKDGLIGQGIVSYAYETLGITLAADVMASGIFHNGGIPSGVLKHPGKLSDDAYKRLKDSWSEQQGGRKSGSTSILEEGMTYEPVDIDAEALQFLQSRKFGVLEIARFLGLPPTKLFDTDAATYSNVENANLEVATDTIDSWAVNFEMEADVKLLNYRYGGRYTEIDLYSVFRGDMGSRASYFKSMMSIGALTANEARRKEGMSPYPEGDKFYIATNNFTPVDRMDEVIDAQIASKDKSDSTDSNDKPDDSDDNSNQDERELTQAAINFLRTK